MFDYLSGLGNVNRSTTAGVESGQIAPILGIIINFMIGGIFSVCILSIAYAGIMYTMSRGDKVEVHKAYSTFLWASIAAAITVGVVAIKNAIVGTFGLTQANVLNNLPSF